MPSQHRIGLLAAVLLAAAAALRWGAPETNQALEFACWRIGAVLSAVWLAYPQLVRLPSWLVVASILALLVGAAKPKFLWVAIPLLVVAALLRPRGGRVKG